MTSRGIRVNGEAGVICVDGLRTGYGASAAVEDVSFRVPRGALVGLIGPNGSGKSTLLKTLIGLLVPWSGRVEVLGRAPKQARARVGYMPQTEAVDWSFPVSVREAVAMGRYQPAWGVTRLRRLLHHDADLVDQALARVGLQDVAGRQVSELSGGQRRRALIARTLVRDPEILLLDEPAAGLDVTTEELLLRLFTELRAQGKTVVVATHDISAVHEHYTMACCINRTLIAAGDPREVLQEDVLVRTFGHQLVVFREDDHGYTAEPHVVHGVHEHD